MRLVLLRIGRARTDWADAAVQDYGRRLAKSLPFEEQLIRPVAFKGDVAAVQAAETAALLGRLKPGDQLYALDERGERPTTEGFAGWIDKAAQGGTGRLVFAIGGPYGHSPALRDRADMVLALSSMVLNHELARVVLVEQLYRASTLIWGGSYHH